MHRDLYSNFAAKIAVAPQVASAAVNGDAIDAKDSNGVVIAVLTGALIGAAIFGAKLQDSDDAASWTDVPAARIQSNVPAVLAASSAYRLGYAGRRRYVRLALTYTSGTSLAVAATAFLRPLSRPVA